MKKYIFILSIISILGCADTEMESTNVVENIIIPTQTPLDRVADISVPKDISVPNEIIPEITKQENSQNKNFERKIVPTIDRSSNSSKYREAYVYETSTPTPTPVSPEVYIPDSSLEQLIRFEINKSEGNITEKDMQKLNYILSKGELEPISDLTGLEYAYNLTSIEILEGAVTNLVPLSNLTKISRINLYQNNVRSIEPISGLFNLEYLDLGSNIINDISSLENINSLEFLDISENKISNIYPISDKPLLHTLYADDNNIGDIRPIITLKDLSTLSIEDNPINDIRALGPICWSGKVSCDIIIPTPTPTPTMTPTPTPTMTPTPTPTMTPTPTATSTPTPTATPTITPTPKPNSTPTPTPTKVPTPTTTPTPTITPMVHNWAYTSFSQTLLDTSIGDTNEFNLEDGHPVRDFDNDGDITDEVYAFICPVGTDMEDITWSKSSYKSNENSLITPYEYGTNGIGYGFADCEEMREVDINIVSVSNNNSHENANISPVVTITFPEQDTDGGFLQRILNRPGQVRALDTIWFLYNSEKYEYRGYY